MLAKLNIALKYAHVATVAMYQRETTLYTYKGNVTTQFPGVLVAARCFQGRS